MRPVCLLALATLGAACHSPGPYGYSVDYAPLDKEDDAVEYATEYDPVMAKRDQDNWSQRLVHTFGVVEHRQPFGNGMSELRLSVRSLAPRNLCNAEGEETCRVTVSEREHDKLSAVIQLREEDDIGRVRVGPDSLVRVVGKLDYDDGVPVLYATYYRHWPKNKYVTTAARSYMKR